MVDTDNEYQRYEGWRANDWDPRCAHRTGYMKQNNNDPDYIIPSDSISRYSINSRWLRCEDVLIANYKPYDCYWKMSRNWQRNSARHTCGPVRKIMTGIERDDVLPDWQGNEYHLYDYDCPSLCNLMNPGFYPEHHPMFDCALKPTSSFAGNYYTSVVDYDPYTDPKNDDCNREYRCLCVDGRDVNNNQNFVGNTHTLMGNERLHPRIGSRPRPQIQATKRPTSRHQNSATQSSTNSASKSEPTSKPNAVDLIKLFFYNLYKSAKKFLASM